MIKTYIKTETGSVDRSLVSVPENRIFRDAWQLSGDVIEVNMTRARDLWRDKIREARIKAFVPLDNLYRQKTEELIPAQARGEDVSSLISEIEAISQQKTQLRNAPEDPLIEAAQTPQELQEVQPAGLVVT